MLVLLLLAGLCLAANLKRKRDDEVFDYSENGYISKVQKTEAIPADVWYMLLSAGNFEFARELAQTSTDLQTYVQDAAYNYLMKKIKLNEFLNEDIILRLMPFFLKYLETAKHDTNLPLTFTFLFKHAKSHNYASKIYKAWKSLGLILTYDRALIDALQESVGFPSGNPVPMYFLRINHMYRTSQWYSYIYPTILLKYRPISNAVWKPLFHSVLHYEYGGRVARSAEEKASLAAMKTLTAEVWSAMTRQQQDESLELISRTIVFSTGRSKNEDFIPVSEATMKLVGRSLPRMSCSDLQEELESMDVSGFHDILVLGPRIHLPDAYKIAGFWAEKVGRVRQLCNSISSPQHDLRAADFKALNDYNSWSVTKLTTFSSIASGRTVDDQIRRKIARHVWELTDLNGMLIFSFLIFRKLSFLVQALEEFLEDSGSALKCVTGTHLKFITIMEIKELGAIVRESVTADLMFMAESYKTGQLPSPLDSKMADPDIAEFVVKCIKDEPLLAAKYSIYALLQLLPNLKRFI